jgi:AcrR family transcriptional regulator
MKPPLFTEDDFIAAARKIAAAGGPRAVTVTSVSGCLKAPVGSFYHRFESRQVLLAKLWLSTVDSFQSGYFAALEENDGLAAALHVAGWSRSNFEDAKVLLVYNLKSFEESSWPPGLKRAAEKQWQAVEAALARFSSHALGSRSKGALAVIRFAVASAPVAAVRTHLERDERPPRVVDALVQSAFYAALETWQN